MWALVIVVVIAGIVWWMLQPVPVDVDSVMGNDSVRYYSALLAISKGPCLAELFGRIEDETTCSCARCVARAALNPSREGNRLINTQAFSRRRNTNRYIQGELNV